MKIIKICIGSACYIKESDNVIEIFKYLINEYKLNDQLELSASFCLGECTNAVSVKRWDGKLLSVSKENGREIFEREIIPYL